MPINQVFPYLNGWINKQISIQLGQALSQDNEHPIRSFFKDSLIYFNWQKNLIQFPYIFKWGIKGHLGWNYNEADAEPLINIALSSITTLQFMNPQFIVPFIEIGASTWNTDFDHFSDISFFWGSGILLSMALLKPSLSYTLPDEYNLHDLGFLLQFVQQYEAIDHSSYFFHFGIYLIF